MSLIGTMDSGVSALRTFQKGLEVIGNNIANVNTTGFKSADAKYSDSFSNILQQSSPAPAGGGSNTPTIGVGTGVGLAGIATNFSQGSLSATGSDTDLGISGNGYFIVTNPSGGISYATRSGSFRMDSQGYLTTQQGYRVQGFKVASGAGGTVSTTVGDIKLATPPV